MKFACQSWKPVTPGFSLSDASVSWISICHHTKHDTHCLPSCSSLWIWWTAFPYVIYLLKRNRDNPRTWIHNLASFIHFENILETSAALFLAEKRQSLKKKRKEKVHFSFFLSFRSWNNISINPNSNRFMNVKAHLSTSTLLRSQFFLDFFLWFSFIWVTFEMIQTWLWLQCIQKVFRPSHFFHILCRSLIRKSFEVQNIFFPHQSALNITTKWKQNFRNV